MKALSPEECIAFRELRFVRHGGHERIIYACIGQIERQPDGGDYSYTCSLCFGPSLAGFHNVYGLDALHALSVACASIATYLGQLASSGKLYWSDGREFDPLLVDATSFRNLVLQKFSVAGGARGE
jgi:hypothetical protein